LILAHTDYDFISQMFFQYEVEIRTGISRIGTKSYTVYQEAWQQNKLCVKGNSVIVYYDFNIEKSAPIPEDRKKLLEEHLI
jgi:acyl-CoA thioester hydrolase